MKRILFAVVLAAVAAGCASYKWTSSVPGDMRTVQVPTFRNRSELTETGSVVSRQLLREFQREGTFRIMSDGAALEVQGEVFFAGSQGAYSNYKIGSRYHGGTMCIKARVSVVDKKNGRVIIDNREFSGESQYSAGQDNTTAMRDASGRAADDLARKVVDCVLGLDFKVKSEKK